MKSPTDDVADTFRVGAFRAAADTADRVGMERLRRSVELGTPTI